MTAVVHDREHTPWPYGICPRCDRRVRIFPTQYVTFTHRDDHGQICRGSGMFAKETR